MSRFRDAVLRATTACKNRLKIRNVYDCVRPLLLLMGLFGLGGTRICESDGVYTVRNSGFSLLVFTFASLALTPYTLIRGLQNLFVDPGYPRPVFIGVIMIMDFFLRFLSRSAVAIGCCMTHVHCERLDRMFRIIHNIDSQLKQANIRVKHWQITLKAIVLALITANYYEIVTIAGYYHDCFMMMMTFSFHFLYVWTILFRLIIHERFVCLNELLQENATAINIRIVGGRNPRDICMLRRIKLARHVHEQLTEVVRLFSDTCRYVVVGLITVPIIDSLFDAFYILASISTMYDEILMLCLVTQMIRLVVFIGICQANKAERRVLTSRLRHLVAFETDREIIQQMQQYIMYNAHSVQGLIDFQFADIDNVLLFTIVDVIVSNIFVIYSHTRAGEEYVG